MVAENKEPMKTLRNLTKFTLVSILFSESNDCCLHSLTTQCFRSEILNVASAPKSRANCCICPVNNGNQHQIDMKFSECKEQDHLSNYKHKQVSKPLYSIQLPSFQTC